MYIISFKGVVACHVHNVSLLVTSTNMMVKLLLFLDAEKRL